MNFNKLDFDSVREAFDFLISRRLARTLSGDGPKLYPNESEVAKMLRRFLKDNSDNYELLRHWLASYGFELCNKDSNTAEGIPRGSEWFYIVRAGDSKQPPWMGLSEIRRKLAPGRRKESETLTRRWAYFLWHMLLGLLYTRTNRLPESVADHTKAWFTKSELLEITLAKTEELRNIKREERSKDIQMLLKNSDENHIKLRISSLLEVLTEINHIAKTAHKDEYVQTLVGAEEISRHASIGFSHIIPDELLEDGFKQEQFEELYEETTVISNGGDNGSS